MIFEEQIINDIRSTASIAVAVITREINFIQFALYQKIFKDCNDITLYFFEDIDPTCIVQVSKIDSIFKININRTYCQSKGYQNSSFLTIKHTRCIAWDKALFFFAELKKDFNQVWFVEDDVLIARSGTVEFFLNNTTYDLVCKELIPNIYGEQSWLWPNVKNVKLPWYRSMICVVGLSRTMLNFISAFVKLNGELEFLEYLIPSLAAQNNLSIKCAKELKKIEFAKYCSRQYLIDNPLVFYHPCKSVNTQFEFFTSLENKKQKPKINIRLLAKQRFVRTVEILYQGYCSTRNVFSKHTIGKEERKTKKSKRGSSARNSEKGY